MDIDIYKKAEQFLPWNLQNKALNTTIFPYWSNDALYYFQQTALEVYLIKINCITGIKEKILVYKTILSALSQELKQEINPEELTFDKFSVSDDSHTISFIYKKKEWFYDLKTQAITHEPITLQFLESPNRKLALTVCEHNLILVDLMNEKKYQLTDDGKLYYDYASSPETNTSAITDRLANVISKPIALWSPDSRKIITHKLDQRQVPLLHLMQNSPNGSQRPKLHSYRMSFSGDSDIPQAELIVVDTVTHKITTIKVEPFLSPYLTPLEFKWIWWSNDSQKIYFLRETRASKELMLYVADANSGNTQVLITEQAETYIEPNQFAPWEHQVVILEDSKQIVWFSERSGFAHLYLYDMTTSRLKNAITMGEWIVRKVHFYDTETNWLYFTGCGYDRKIDPYYKQLFRCRLDGSEVECLTPENASHTVSFAPNNKYFLDTYSTISTAPISVLKNLEGHIICNVEIADISELEKLKWVRPLRFCVKARDGITSIYGNLYFPSNFNANGRYPLVDHIYPGPQFYRTPQHFSIYGSIFRSAWTAQALAELGFIVMHVDGFGTPGRSKDFHDKCYKNMSDGGIPDHVAAIQQLAAEHNFIDSNRIGVTGYSGGGYMAARAMLMFPDFYKVGVAAAGNHDLRCYPASYGEKYNSLDSNTYSDQSNVAHAEKLNGKLLLIHGEMDDNVHPCATLQLVDALIKHNKDFDMLIMPNQNHSSTFDHPYYLRRQWDYFLNHLSNEQPPKNHLIKPMPEDFPQIMDW